MAFPAFIAALRRTLSFEAQILTDPLHVEFQHSLQRWSDIDLQVPGAIIKPTSEADAVNIVKSAVETCIPFVPSCGGHSPWSTIGTHGFILDLSLDKDIEVDAANSTVKIRGGVLMKEMTAALTKAGQCAPFASGNTVGVIPYYLSGGISTLSSILGFASDSIISVRVITATGALVIADVETNPDLLWAIKGAGQFFGVITELTIQTYPLSSLGSNGDLWTGKYIFPIERAEEVCCVMENIIFDKDKPTVGHMTVTAPPKHLTTEAPKEGFHALLIVSSHYLGAPENGPAVFKTLEDLHALKSESRTTAYQNLADHLDHLCIKGGFKRFSPAGLREFRAENFLQVIGIFLNLLRECPDAGASGYHFQWHSRLPRKPFVESAMSHHDIRFWLNCLSSYTDPHSHTKVLQLEQEALAAMRVGQNEADFVDYQGVNRVGPAERRYRGAGRLATLKRLKRQWDSQGVFTEQLL